MSESGVLSGRASLSQPMTVIRLQFVYVIRMPRRPWPVKGRMSGGGPA
jgi:hypothetical protein